MPERPEYVPPWMNWPTNTWTFGAPIPPGVVVAWFGGFVTAGIALLIGGLFSGSLVLMICGGAASVLLTSQAAIYVPRAWRAYKGSSSN